MLWFIQLMIAVFMTVLYISISKVLGTNSSFLDKQLFCSLGIGIFSLFLLIFWMCQYSTHHTIIYWRIIELFK